MEKGIRLPCNQRIPTECMQRTNTLRVNPCIHPSADLTITFSVDVLSRQLFGMVFDELAAGCPCSGLIILEADSPVLSVTNLQEDPELLRTASGRRGGYQSHHGKTT